ERLARAETLAEGLRQAAGALDAGVEAEAMAELAGLTQKAAAETNLLDKHLDAQTLKDCKAGKLSAEQLKRLAEALRGSKQDVAATLEKLRRANLIDPEVLAKCACAGCCDGAAMAELLKEQGGKQAVADLLSRCQGAEKAGRGGVNEGPGAAK